MARVAKAHTELANSSRSGEQLNAMHLARSLSLNIDLESPISNSSPTPFPARSTDNEDTYEIVGIP